MTNKKVSVLIPAYNEAELIEKTVKASFSIPYVNQVVVVDDGSIDSTATLAKRAGAKVKRMPFNGGKGEALNMGVELLANPFVLLLDADLGESAAKAAPLLDPVLEGEADMSIAIFPPSGKKGGFGFVKRLAVWGIKRYGNGLEVKAPLSGQRAMTIDVLKEVFPFAKGYGVEVALTIKAAKAGFIVKEILVPFTHHKETGRDLEGFKHRGKQFKDVFKTLNKLKKEYKL